MRTDALSYVRGGGKENNWKWVVPWWAWRGSILTWQGGRFQDSMHDARQEKSGIQLKRDLGWARVQLALVRPGPWTVCVDMHMLFYSFLQPHAQCSLPTLVFTPGPLKIFDNACAPDYSPKVIG